MFSDVPKMNFILAFLSFFFIIHLSKTQDQLQFVHVLFRHGARTPVTDIPTWPVSWPQGLGELTEDGMKELYHLGSDLKDRYINSNFLQSNYSPFEIYVRSTDYNRTLMSAYSFLAGMYPPTSAILPNIMWQPIPVHTRPKENDPMLYTNNRCPTYDTIYQQILQNDTYKRLTQENQDLLDFLRLPNVTNVTNLDISSMYVLEDPLSILKLTNQSLPPWALNKWPNDSSSVTVYDKVIQLDAYAWSFLYHDERLARLRGGILLDDIITRLQAFKDQKLDNRLKIYIYSAHDITVAAFLEALRAYDSIPPNYAATVIIELWKNATTGELYVKALHRDPVVSGDTFNEIKINNCTDLTCPFDTWATNAASFRITQSLYNTECFNTTTTTTTTATTTTTTATNTNTITTTSNNKTTPASNTTTTTASNTTTTTASNTTTTTASNTTTTTASNTTTTTASNTTTTTSNPGGSGTQILSNFWSWFLLGCFYTICYCCL